MRLEEIRRKSSIESMADRALRWLLPSHTKRMHQDKVAFFRFLRKLCPLFSEEVAALLLEYGADVNLYKPGSPTPFLNVCLTGTPERIERLVSIPGINTLNVVAMRGETALTAVCRLGDVKRVQYLLDLITS